MDDMRIELSHEQLAALSDFELGKELIQPAIQPARGQRLEKKRDIYDHLTPGQKSLFAFWVLYGHTGAGWLQFFQVGRYNEEHDQYLLMIKSGLGRIDAQSLLENLYEAEKLFTCYRQGMNGEQYPASFDDILGAFTKVDEKLLTILPETMRKMEAYIRANPEEFVIFTD